ncbi:M6 family metalloprotease domain-containing protein [bacterium]|nr:M6 family metalloprotease domain-containing protein [bacterium]
MNSPLRLSLALQLLVAAALLAFAIPAAAHQLPNEEEIQRLKNAGQWEPVYQNLLSMEDLTHQHLHEGEVLDLILDHYGLPTQISTPTQPSGDLRVNFDGNDVIDERDILGLGFGDLERDAALNEAGLNSRGASTTLPIGTVAQNNAPKCLILLIKFTDQAPTDKKNQGAANDVNHDSAWAEDRWFDLTTPGALEDASVAHFYKQNSYGKLELTGDCFDQSFGAGGNTVADSEGWITSAYTRAQVVSGNKSFYEVTSNAISQIDPHVNFSNYDSNGDGYLDGLITIYAGADGGGANQLWYFRWVYSPQLVTADNVRISSGQWVSEQGYFYLFCHEMGHELGLPDLYDTNGSSGGSQAGTGFWCIMSGWSTSQGVKPPFHDAWSRMHMRWVDPVEVASLGSATSLTVNRATSASPDNTVYRIWRNGAIGKEFFLVEYRDSTHGYDDSLPTSGLLIWHVDENRSSGRNTDNAFSPQRVWLEVADNGNDPFSSQSPWRSGYNGPDGKDFFDDTSSPNSRDNAGATTGVVIDPTSANSGPSMTMDVTNTTGTPPTVSWESPNAGATVSGNVLVDAASSATGKVEYYINDCLKHVDTAPTFDGFTWDTLTALNGTARLRAIAVNSGQTVTVIDRTVTVNNAAGTGKSVIYSDNFNSYTSDSDNTLLGAWNLREDAMGLDIQCLNASSIKTGLTGKVLAFAQTSFAAPPNDPGQVDPNVGIYQGNDREYLMSPRINLSGYNNLQLKYKVAMRSYWTGEAILVTQISSDNGATWNKLESLSWYPNSPPPAYNAGIWDGDPTFSNFAQRTVSLQSYLNQDVYIRFFFVGGLTPSVGMAFDDFEVTGDPFSITSASPSRRQIGQSVTITGNGFGASQGDGKVRFNNGAGGFVEQATVTSWNNTQIVCNVPAGAVSNDPNGIWVYKSTQETNKLPFKIILGAPSLGGLGQL